MNNFHFNGWADSISSNLGKAYERSKGIFSSARDHASDSIHDIQSSAAVKRMMRSLPQLKSQVNAMQMNARKNMENAYSGFAHDLCVIESMALKLSGLYLLIKWYQNREKDACGITQSVKSHVIEKPMTSAAIAIALGYMLGRLRK